MEKGSEKGLETRSALANNSLFASLFPDSEGQQIIFKRTERIASALYLITGFFSDEEPMKWRLRKLGSKLVSSDLFVLDESGDKGQRISIARNIVLEISNLLIIAKNSGLISEANYSLMDSELSRLVRLILGNSGFGDNRSLGQLEAKFFDVPEEKAEAQRYIEQVSKKSEGIKDKTSEQPNQASEKSGYLPSMQDYSEREKEENKPKSAVTPRQSETSSRDNKAQLREFGAVSVKKNARQSAIVSLLKRKKEIMIKDVSPLISDCSEKTIQRELLSMVDAGILKKTGEKRWSRYSLA